MGRKTFETVLSFPKWPYSKPVFVLSHKKRVVPSHLEGRVFFTTLSPKKLLSYFEENSLNNVYVDGVKPFKVF